MAQYQAPKVPATKFNVPSRLVEVERCVSNLDNSLRELTTRFDKLPKPAACVPPAKGERGPQGLAGADGKNGRDGRDAVGIQGPQGRPGKDCQCRTELASQTLARVEKNLSDTREQFAALRQDFETLRLAFTTSSKRSAEYLDFLRARIAERMKKQ
jgi:hypothetical protein